jgi:hypothetical protein
MAITVITRPGQRLTFHRAAKGITQNETLKVVWAGKGIVARNDPGEERTLTAKQSKSFEVYEQHGIESASGDKLLYQSPRLRFLRDQWRTRYRLAVGQGRPHTPRRWSAPAQTTNSSLTDKPIPHTAARAS